MAGDGDAERLVVLLEARVRDFEKNMAKASGTATQSYGKMRQGSQSATRQMEQDMVRSTTRVNQALATTSTKIGDVGKAMVGGFLGGLVAGGISGIVSRLGSVAHGVAEIGDEAKRAGLSIEAFQELKYVAEQNRIGVDALTDGIKELNLRADEFIVTGGGSAAEAFQRLGYNAEDLNKKLQDPSALFTEIIGKLKYLDSAARIRIADELFGGTGGEQFVQLIGQGEEGIGRTIDEAHNLGIVMSDEVVAKAAEVDRKFNQIANTVGSALQSAIVDAAEALNGFLNALGQTPAEHFGALRAEAAGIEEELRQIVEHGTADFPQLRAEVQQLVDGFIDGRDSAKDAKEALLDIARQNPDFAHIIALLNPLIAKLEMVTGRAREAASAVAEKTMDPIESMPSSGMVATFATPGPTTKPGSGSPARKKAADDTERQAKAVKDLIAGLEFEKSLIGLSAVQQAKLTALRQAGAAATDKQRERIGALVEQTYAEQQRIEYLQDAFDLLGDMGRSAIDGIIDALADGKIEASEFGEILSNVLGMAANFFLNQAFSGLGSLLGFRGFSSGTENTGGSRGEVRGIVHGQEAVIPLPNGGKVPVQITNNNTPATTNGTKVKVDVQVSVDRSGNIQAAVQRIAQEETARGIAAYDKVLPNRIEEKIRRGRLNPYRRGSGWGG